MPLDIAPGSIIILDDIIVDSEGDSASSTLYTYKIISYAFTQTQIIMHVFQGVYFLQELFLTFLAHAHMDTQ